MCNVAKIIPTMNGIGFDIQELQSIIKCKIRAFSDSVARKVAFNAMPIDALLPIDTVQHILSFNHCKNIKTVSKSFKKRFDQNQKAILRSRKRIAEENSLYFAPDITFDDSGGRIHVVRPAGEPLTKSIKELTSMHDSPIHSGQMKTISSKHRHHAMFSPQGV